MPIQRLNTTLLKDGRRAIVMRTSDRIQFKKCRRAWNWSSHLKGNWGPSNLASPLWFGSAIHFALEDYHGHNRFDTPADAFRAYCVATSKQHLRDLPHDAMELFRLGTAMMNYYTSHWLRHRKADKTFILDDIPQVEVDFEIEVPLDEYPRLRELLKYHDADCILYRGTIDRVAIDEFGRLWVCVAKDTWVGSTSGICKIQDHPDAKFMGIKETVVICATGGYKVECTPDHQILTASRGWVEAQSLNEADELVIGDYSPYLITEDSDYWWTIGYWFGDGSLRNHGRGSIDFSTGNDNEELSGYLDQFFSSRGERVRYAANKKTTGYAYVTNQAAFADDLRALFSTIWDQGKTKYKKNSYIPLDRIQNLPAFLRGLFDADGSVAFSHNGMSRIGYSNKSAEVVSQVQQALAFLGIKSSISHLTRDQYKWSSLTITDGESVRKFVERVGFRLRRKQEAICFTSATRSVGPRVVSVLPGRKVEVYDLLNQPNKQFAAGGIIVHNCEYKTAKIAEQMHFLTDPQITSYVWAAKNIYGHLGYEVAGVIYMQFVKKLPEPPKILASGKISTAQTQVTSATLYQDALERMYGDVMKAPEANREFLTGLMLSEDENKDKYIQRAVVERNDHMCAMEAQKIILELEDMLNPNLPLYPSPTRECSRMCSFVAPCVSFDDGSDWEYTIEHRYAKRDQAADRLWRRRLPHPDKLVAMRKKDIVPDLEEMQIALQSLPPAQQEAIEKGEEEIAFTFSMN